MSIAAPILAQDKVIEQVKGLQVQKAQLDIQVTQLEEKLKQIETSLAENEKLKVKVQELQQTSLNLFEEESKRRPEYYPDLYLKSIEKIASLYAEPEKKQP